MSMSDARSIEPPARGLPGDRTGPLWFALCVLGPMPVFWFGITGLVDAWATPEYSHGPLIPLLSGYMFMREMAMMPPPVAPVRDRAPGLLVIALALALAVLGNLVRIPDIVFYAIILWVMGVVLVCFGFRRGLFFWPAVLHLVFMVPLPQFLYWKVNVTLQFVSSEIGVWLVRAAGIPVFLDGNVIDLGVYKLLVAEACSGLRYLFPIMSFSYIFCVLYRGPWIHKAILLLAAVPLAVLMNSFRIGVIGILVDNYGIEHAEGFLHYFEGWVIFGACVALLFGLARFLQFTAGDRRPLSVALDLEYEGLGAQFRRVFDLTASPALIAAGVGATALSAAWLAAPTAAPVSVERRDFDTFPQQIGEWRGALEELTPGVEKVLAADDYLASTFRRPGGDVLDFFVAYYDKQTEGSGIHSPEVCIPAGGWEMFDIRPTEIAPPADSGLPPLILNRAIIQKGEEQELVYYWFEQRGRRLTNDFVAKLYTIYDSVMMGRTDGALVRLMTPIHDKNEAAADSLLRGFMADALPLLGDYVPE